jgi:RNA polymerase sigma-70 factor (ECF subfamily)
MVANPDSKPARPTGELLTSARQGSGEALGQVLESCRAYLMLVANKELDRDLRAKLGPSDLVQETFVTAQRAFERFSGESLDEVLAWLRQILLIKIGEARRHYYRSQRRAITREARPASPLADSSFVPEPIANGYTPHRQLVTLETAERISLAMAALSSDHQQVIRLRNWQVLAFDEIGRQMNRSAGAARALWIRAMDQLARTLEPRHE